MAASWTFLEWSIFDDIASACADFRWLCCAFTYAGERTSPAPSSKEKPKANWIFAWDVKEDSLVGCSRSSPAVELAPAQRAVLSMVSLLLRIERESKGRVRICRNVTDIQRALKDGVLAPVLHIEGAEAIDPNFEFLDVLYAAGLRSLGPVWSRPNAFGHGVPFRCPSSPDTGPGLTDLGKELIGACNRLRILIDLSHLNERGFWDVAAISDAPLVATHSNAHALSPHSRNLTDKQLAAIRDTGGIVGVNFATSFLRPDGHQNADTPTELVIEHLEHMLKQVGEGGVGFGSDFDGATIPAGIGNAAGLQNLVEIMRTRGYDEPLIETLCFKNWLRVLGQTWGEAQNISRTNDCDANKSREPPGPRSCALAPISTRARPPAARQRKVGRTAWRDNTPSD